MGAAVGGSNFAGNVSDQYAQTDAAQQAISQAEGILNQSGPVKADLDLKTTQDSDQNIFQEAGDADNTDRNVFNVG